MRFVHTFMNRITFSCNNITANELEWLSARTMRKFSNLISFLIAKEVERQLAEMPEDERAEVYASLTGVRVLC
jgi:hypothetical protein